MNGIEPSKLSVIVLSGYRISVNVNNGMLSLSDGIGNERREGRFSRAQRSFNRLIIIGHSGYISLEAVKWLNDTGIAFAQIDYDTTYLLEKGGSRL